MTESNLSNDPDYGDYDESATTEPLSAARSSSAEHGHPDSFPAGPSISISPSIPSDDALASIFEASLFGDCEPFACHRYFKLEMRHLRLCLVDDRARRVTIRVLSRFGNLSFTGQRVEFRSNRVDTDSRLLYTDDLPVFSFVCTYLKDAIHSIQIPLDGVTSKECHFTRQLDHFNAVERLIFFNRGDLDGGIGDEPDLVNDKQVTCYADLIKRCAEAGVLRHLSHPGVTLPKCLDVLTGVELDYLRLELDEADCLLGQDQTLKTNTLYFKTNFFKPSALFTKIQAVNVILHIRFKFSRPRENEILPSPSVQNLTCKISFMTNFEEAFDYINQVFPNLKTFDTETNWAIASLCSFETFNPSEKLAASLHDCFRVICRIEAAGLRAKSKGAKMDMTFRVQLLMPSEDTTFFSNKDVAKNLRDLINDRVESDFIQCPKVLPGVTRHRHLSEHYLILESKF